MAEEKIDGRVYTQMVRGGVLQLSKHAKEVNDLNVFPIPDGDTGENMLLTLKGGAEAKDGDGDLSSASRSVSDSMLLSARGNSGVILSQFFEGIAKGFAYVKEADVKKFGDALKEGVEYAYRSVLKPTEGTILTVIREATDHACGTEAKTPEEFLVAFIEEAKRSLARTPDLLPVLKKAGVVDSGGAGIIYIVEGMLRALSGESLDYVVEKSESSQSEIDLDAFDEDSVLEFGYCTELLLRLQNAKTDIKSFDTSVITDYLETIGNSIVCVGNGSVVKIHVHTMTPQRVLDFCQRYGEFLKVKIENMSLQHNSIVENDKNTDTPPAIRKKFGVVAVANGQGIKDAFADMGADIIVEGGQSMNPSAQSFLDAFDRVNADTVFVLPNNSNIVLVAEQASKMYQKSDIRVIKTRTVGEGYAVLSLLDTTCADADAIEAECNEAKEGVKTAEISPCIRTVDMDGVHAEAGDYIGFMGKTLLSSHPSRLETAKGAVDKMSLSENSVAIIICGEDSTDEESEALYSYVSSKFPMLEIYMLNGGQTVYSYIIVGE